MRDIKIDDNPFQRQMWDRLASRDLSISVSDKASLSDVEEFITLSDVEEFIKVSVIRDIAQSVLDDVFNDSQFMHEFSHESDFQDRMFDIAFQQVQEIDAMNQRSNEMSRIRGNVANQFWIAVAKKMHYLMSR